MKKKEMIRLGRRKEWVDREDVSHRCWIGSRGKRRAMVRKQGRKHPVLMLLASVFVFIILIYSESNPGTP